MGKITDSSYALVSSLNSTDTFPVVQGGQVKRATIADIETAVADASRWTEISTGNYTSTPAGNQTITMSDTTGIVAGLPIRVTQSSAFRYLIVNSVTANTSIDVRGPSLGGTPVTKLEVGKPEQVFEIFVNVAGGYGAVTSTSLLATYMDTAYRWRGAAARFVQGSFWHKTQDSTSAPVVNVLLNGSRAIQDGSPVGVAVVGAATWNDSNFIDPLVTSISRGQTIELECVAAGGAGDASNLAASLTFILE